MPHQLRQIIAINIRNPKDDLPSGRIAKLDPRGGVLAVGINGVGKTTFLRLLPLFYGATPQQILRGTGLSSMIAHTLPDASSAVAFEYERETENDLRCVVMHCRPGEDSPQFHIIHGGYRENFFYDENNQFVLRNEFKARVEALGFQVSRKLLLNQYRSVILNERVMTKESDEMRRLAAVHSLGPKALYNLDQIAAAMANEKISFRDLRTIVIDRVSDAQSDGSGSMSSRELKRNRGDVSHWLDDRDHLAKIMAARPESEKMQNRITKVKGIHLELCSLHVAVKEALGQCKVKLEGLDAKETSIKQACECQQIVNNELTLAAKEEKRIAKEEWSGFNSKVEAVESKQAHFKKINIDDLEAEHDFEESLKADKASKESELDALNTVSGGIAVNTSLRKQAIENANKPEIDRINQMRVDVLHENTASCDAVRDSEIQSIDAFESPIRLNEISKEQNSLISRQGELKILIANPMASIATRDKKQQATFDVNRLAEDYQKKVKASQAAREEARKAQTNTNAALEQLSRIETEEAGVAKQLEEAKLQLSPGQGTLLAFLRATNTSLWLEGAKILDPLLLERTDLSPLIDENNDFSYRHQGADSGRLSLGGITLDVQALNTPAWAEMSDIRKRIMKLEVTLTQIGVSLQTQKKEVQGFNTTLDSANTHASTSIAAESMAEIALANAKAILECMNGLVAKEEEDAKRDAVGESEEKKNRIQELISEVLNIRNGMEATKKRIREEFKQQRKRLADELAKTQVRLEQEKKVVMERMAEELAQVDDDAVRTLAGLGIDPKRLTSIEREISTLAKRLVSISSFRHEVAGWRLFKHNTLPGFMLLREKRQELKERCDQVDAKLKLLSTQLDTLERLTKQELETLDKERSHMRRETTQLQELIQHGLHEFTGHVAERQHVNWNIQDLKSRVDQAKSGLATESDMLQKEIRSLRNIMTMRTGPVEHWMQLKEKDLPDPQTLLGHQFDCEKAQILCDWFNPIEHVSYVDQLHKEMDGFLAVASNFVRDLELFERRVESFNGELQKALKKTGKFERFRDLTVTVRSGVSQIGHIKLLRHMQDVHQSKTSSYRSFMTQEREIPTDTEAALIRSFRDILPSDGVLRVNLNEQVLLECSLIEAGKPRTISNDEEFRAVSSNGNTALITAMFLMGFVEMIRGTNSPVRLTWVTDEIGRFDANNLGEFLHILDAHKIDVISASPSVDPALARFFKRLCIFGGTGAIDTSDTPLEGDVYVET